MLAKRRIVKNSGIEIINPLEGEISIMEPEKCSELVWLDLEEFPSDVIEFERIAMNLNEEGIKFSVIDVENE